MSLAPIDATSEAAVSDYLTMCRDWLATCVEMTGPEQIAAAKAEIATAAEATKQLGLSKEIQLDAQEMVRRAEYALGKAIRKGQAEGLIRRTGEIVTSRSRWNGEGRSTTNSIKASPSDFASKSELAGQVGGDGIYGMSDDVPAEDFEQAITEAKAEGNLSRATSRVRFWTPVASATPDNRVVTRTTAPPAGNAGGLRYGRTKKLRLATSSSAMETRHWYVAPRVSATPPDMLITRALSIGVPAGSPGGRPTSNTPSIVSGG